MEKVKHNYPGLEIYRGLVRERRGGALMLVQATRTDDGKWSVSAGDRVIGLAASLSAAKALARSPAAFEKRLVGEVYPHYHYEMALPEGAYERVLRLSFYLHDLGLEPASIYRDEDDKLVALMKPVGM
jgi:hypothetical protein